MKALYLALFFGACAVPAVALPVMIFPREARAHLGQAVTVRGVIDGVHEGRDATYIFLDGRGAHAAMLVVLRGDDALIFPDITTDTGKTIEVSGRVEQVQGKPAIFVQRRTQLYFKD